jgi:hypothetical protein
MYIYKSLISIDTKSYEIQSETVYNITVTLSNGILCAQDSKRLLVEENF